MKIHSYVDRSGDARMNQPQPKLSRRSLFAGAAGVGALAATATLIPAAPEPILASLQPKEAPAAGGGYSLSEHVKRYYQTTRV
jgi:hypothetical protein